MDNTVGNGDNDDGNGGGTFLFISTTFCLSDCPMILQSRCALLCLNRPEAADSRSPQSVVGTALSLKPIDVHL